MVTVTGAMGEAFNIMLIATSLEPDALAPGLSKTDLLGALRGKTLGAASLVLRFAQ